LVGQGDDRPLGAGEAHPAGRHAPTEERDQPGRRVLPEIAERLHGREPGALEPFVRLAADQLDGELKAKAAVHACDAGQGLADDQGHALRVTRLGSLAERQTYVATPAARERLGLVAEIAQDRVVPAAAALGP